MKELRITDAEVQKLLSSALRERLREAGFVMGASSADEPPTFYLPVNLNLAGEAAVSRYDDGTWSFRQETDAMLLDRIKAADGFLSEAIDRASAPLGRT